MRRSPPFRSKEFLRFAKTQTGPCCLHEDRPGVHLHHFGSDGGTGMKPSDNEVARVCQDCHRVHGGKRHSLLRGSWDDILIRYQTDALKLNRAYIEHLEGLREKQKRDEIDDCW